MNATDVRKVKKLAGRLGVRDSDIFRFAVKSALARLGPLNDPEMHGRSLVPVFVEWGSELLRFFDIDAARLEAIINDGVVDSERRVDRDDIALLALTGTQEPYAALKLSQLDKRVERGAEQSTRELAEGLRQYLYAKYLYQNGSQMPAAQLREPVRLAVPEHPKVVEA